MYMTLNTFYSQLEIISPKCLTMINTVHQWFLFKSSIYAIVAVKLQKCAEVNLHRSIYQCYLYKILESEQICEKIDSI